jgi:hypothetical protein
MEGYCSTGQSTQWVVVPLEEEGGGGGDMTENYCAVECGTVLCRR